MAQAALEKNKDSDKLSFTGAVAVIKRDLPLAAVLPPEQHTIAEIFLNNENKTFATLN
jgi:hypothetical protein